MTSHDISFEAIEAKVAEIENAFSFLRDPHIGTALVVITALRARLAEVEGALHRIADLTERWSDSLVSQVNHIARAALASAGVTERLILDSQNGEQP